MPRRNESYVAAGIVDEAIRGERRGVEVHRMLLVRPQHHALRPKSEESFKCWRPLHFIQALRREHGKKGRR